MEWNSTKKWRNAKNGRYLRGRYKKNENKREREREEKDGREKGLHFEPISSKFFQKRWVEKEWKNGIGMQKMHISHKWIDQRMDDGIECEFKWSEGEKSSQKSCSSSLT